jgi:hypothetical protein
MGKTETSASIPSNVEAEGSSFGRARAECNRVSCRIPRTAKQLILGYSARKYPNTQYLAPIQTSKRYFTGFLLLC